MLRRFIVVVLALACVWAAPAWVEAQGGQTTHTVQPGENLYRISLQYNTTVTAIAQANNITNASLIYVGQVLIIPTSGVPQTTATPAPTGSGTPRPTGSPAPTNTAPVVTGTPAATTTAAPTTAPSTGETVYVVQVGDNLFRIGLRYNLQPQVLAAYNGIANPNLIYVGQRIRIPAGVTASTVAVPAAATATAPALVTVTAAPGATAAPTFTAAAGAAPAVTPAPTSTTDPAAQTAPVQSTASNVGFAYGVVVYLPNQDMAAVTTAASNLGVSWTKQYIDWALYEPTQGTINWDPIDEMVDAMDGAGLNILLTVSSAPGWARDSVEEKGPPTDYNAYATFVGAMAERYAGVVDAYEIWNEQNLRREWNTPRGISAASYVELLRLAYTAIKAADPAAVVVTGGLAPTGFNDGVNAIDDRVYLTAMYAAGVADYADAIGAHPNGWANPPDSVCCQANRPQVSGWDDHPSFFFRQTLEDYRQIMMQSGDGSTYLWATEFGWGSSEGFPVDPAADMAFVTFTSLDEQTQYLIRGFQLGSELGYVGPMFVWNLNFCQEVGMTDPQCFWSLLDPAGNPRPVYLGLADVAK